MARALEAVALVTAVGAHLAAAAAAVQQRQEGLPLLGHRQQQQQQQPDGRRMVQAAAVPTAPLGPAVQPAGWAPGGLWLTLPLLAALVLGRIRAWLSGSRCVWCQRL